MKPSHKRHNRDFAGRDPREMTPDKLREAMSPLQAIRAAVGEPG